MLYCPKCETIYDDGEEVCPPCGIELVSRLSRRESLDELEEDYARDLFADEGDVMRYCGRCLREFTRTSTHCGDCGGVGLAELPRAAFLTAMARSQVEPFLFREQPTAPETELVRVLEAPTPGQAAFAAATLEGMGVDVFIGDDLIEADPMAEGIGIFVPADEVEACSMIIPDDLADWFDDEDDEIDAARDTRSPYDRKLALAESHRAIGRRGRAMMLAAEAIELAPDEPRAFDLLGQLAAEEGDHRRAVECFEEAVRRSPDPVTCMSMWRFIVHSLADAEGRPAFKGPAADRALEALVAFSDRHSRMMGAWLLRLELQSVRDAKTAAAATVARIRQVNRWLLDLEGPARATVERWKL
ncbi:MAG: hypothetical protein H6807_05630 [Planctomycetes bacterium]|nr:hypothetical protein [Planctomycetota bacterium]